MKIGTLLASCSIVFSLALALFAQGPQQTQPSVFDKAPQAVKDRENLFDKPSDVATGKKLYAANCLSCHGINGRGNGNIPALRKGDAAAAPAGAIFWFITRGDVPNGMPAWGGTLSSKQRWQIVSYVKSLSTPKKKSGAAAETASSSPQPTETASTAGAITSPMPSAPFYDFRGEAPGTTHKLTVNDLPQPYATESAANGPRLVKKPANAWPKALPGFKVELFASDLDNPRLLRTAPNGDIFLAEMDPGDIKVFRGMTKDGRPQQTSTFATGLKQPFGIAFYPPGPNPEWVYVGNTDEVVRFRYKNGDVKASGAPEHITELPGGGHTTRTLEFSADGKKLYVSVGSRSNVDDPDENKAEVNRADVREYNPDGSGMRVYASGIRNCVGLLRHPVTNQLWCSTNERDALGDNLVPDYITHLEENGFYGWPWWYIGGHQDPRHKGKHPELKDKAIVPDVLLQSHSASLGIAFYTGKQFPSEYKDDLFAAEHGSWNRSTRVGYEVIRVPLHQSGKSDGTYEDFLTGFVLPNGEVWGRPVGVAVAPDGSLLVSDDGSNSIWRVSYSSERKLR